jgi:FkbM family methyltransferase
VIQASFFGHCAHAIKRTYLVRFVRGLVFDGSSIKKAEPKVWRFLCQNLRPGWRCVDVGANRGELTFLMAKMVGRTGFVHAFELNADNAKLLRSNTWRFRHRVRAEHMAVTNGRTAFVDGYPGRNRSGAEWNIIGQDITGARTSAEFRVQATSLDHYFPSGLKIRFVKIDVEGAGGQVLEGMARILSECKPLIVMEVHNAAEWEALQQLKTMNYRLWNLEGTPLDDPDRHEPHCVASPVELSVVSCPAATAAMNPRSTW